MVLVVLNLIIISLFSLTVATDLDKETENRSEFLPLKIEVFSASIGIANASQLQNMSLNLTGNYYLINDIDMNGTSLWDGGQGFDPVGDGKGYFNGTFDGNGFNITDLFIDRTENFVGLFGIIGPNVVVENVNLINANVTGDTSVGILAGQLKGSINNSKAEGAVYGNEYVGGLVGNSKSQDSIYLNNSHTDVNVVSTGSYLGGVIGSSYGDIYNCSAVGNVTGDTSNSDYVGGIVGDFNGNINYASAESIVKGNWNVGGLIGEGGGSINNSYTKGYVHGNGGEVGGLVGISNIVVNNSFSTCNVTSNGYYVGGLMGDDGGSVSNSYATGNVSGDGDVGGLIGFTSGVNKNSYATGNVTATTESGGGLIGRTSSVGRTNNSYSTGNATGGIEIGGFIGENGGQPIEGCYFDTDTSGTTKAVGLGSSVGIAGKNTTMMMKKLTFIPSAWDFDNTWGIIEGNTYPFLQKFFDAPKFITTSLDDSVEDENYSFAIQVDLSSLSNPGQLIWNVTSDAGPWLIHNGSGELYGTPGNNDVGTYWVQVNIGDKFNVFLQHNFTLEVLNTNDPPVINPQIASDATEDEFYNITFDGTDIDPTLDNLTWGFTTNFTSGWLSINATSGELYGTPVNADVGISWINLTASDGNGGVGWMKFDLKVINVNDNPMISLASMKSAQEDEFYSLTITASDPDSTEDILTWNMVTNAGWLKINSANGVVLGTPLNDDANMTYDVNVTVTDGNGGSTWREYSLFVFNANDEPSISTNNVLSTDEDALYNVDYNAEDVDPTNDTMTWALETNAGWLSIDSATGVVSGTPENNHVGTYDVNISVNDGNQGTDYTVFELEVKNTNDPPQITTGDKTTVNVDDLYYVVYAATDIDPTDDILKWDVTTDATWLSMDQKTGVLSGTPRFEDVGTYVINVTVADELNANDFSVFELEVILINNNPGLTTKDVTKATAGEEYSVVYSAYDDRTVAANLSWSFESDATWLSFDKTTLILSGTPSASNEGTYNVKFNVSDGEGGYTIREFSIEVVIPPPPNNPPKLSGGSMMPGSGDTETQFTFSVDYTDDDGDAPASIKVVIDGKENTMKLASGEAADGTYHYTTTLEEGPHSYYFTASDGKDPAEADDSTPTTNTNALSTPTVSASEKKESGGSNTALIVALIIIVIIVIVVVLLFLRRRAEADEEGEELECPKCGAYISRSDDVCPDCGEELEFEDEDEDEDEDYDDDDEDEDEDDEE
jgi:hypothetical protein